MDEFRVGEKSEFDITIVKSTSTGSDELISIRPKDSAKVYSVAGFIQHFFRGHPTHRTDLNGIVSSEGQRFKYVGGVDVQWEVYITSSVMYERNALKLLGGADLLDVQSKVQFRKLRPEVGIFQYTGSYPIFFNFLVPAGGNSYTNGTLRTNGAFASSLSPDNPSFQLLFAERLI